METTVAELVARLRADTTQFTAGMADAEKSAQSTFGRIQSHAKQMGQVGRSLTYGVTLPLVGVFAAGISEAKEAQAVAAQTQAVIKSTGGAAQVSAKHVAELSKQVADLAAVDDEAVQSGANLLLTFKSIRNEAGAGNKIFDRSVELAADLSRAWGQDMKSSAIQLGKALEDPIAGLTSLRRVGIQFTDAQEATIKSLVESGRLMDAQKIILKELETQVGGSAKAYGETMGGQVDRARESFRNATAQLATAMIPTLVKLAEVISTVTTWFQNLDPQTQKAIGAFALLAAATGPVLIGLSLIAAHPVALTLIAIAAAAALVYFHFDEIRAWFARNWDNILSWATGLQPIIEAVEFAVRMLARAFDAVADAARAAARQAGKIGSAVPDVTPWDGLAPDLNPFGAAGAIVTRPTRALIGEAGPEALIPLNRMPGAFPLPNDMGGGGGGNTFYITTADPIVAADETVRQMRAAQFFMGR